jgi:energy-coupling factor transporter ATP-binding protein EcfA2
VLGLVGTNGIGKSTALKVLAGKLKPNLGRFEVRQPAAQPCNLQDLTVLWSQQQCCSVLSASTVHLDRLHVVKSWRAAVASKKCSASQLIGLRLMQAHGQTDFCVSVQSPPDWQEILAHFRGSELQNYFTRILEDDLQATIKPQYVDHIPKAVRCVLLCPMCTLTYVPRISATGPAGLCRRSFSHLFVSSLVG